MRFFVGVTDNEWFAHLARLRPDELNFWRPKGAGFKALLPGAPFLFKLHSPQNYIVGGGFFVRYARVPLSLAWDAFGEKNGAPNLEEFRRLIRKRRGGSDFNPDIGCIILNEPFFFAREEWIPAPESWASNIVTGKGFDTEEAEGHRLWMQVQERLEMLGALPGPGGMATGVGEDDEPRLGREYLTRGRLGQGAFRVLVTSAYQRRCALTGERTLPVLQAAHIQPFTEKGPNRTSNGLLLRSDLHILFDRGYLTVTPEYRVEVSSRIREEFENGRDYYRLRGEPLLVLPEEAEDLPGREFLQYHNREVYVG